MRRTLVWLLCLAAAAFACENARAESVVVLTTSGPKAWTVAENRLIAELRASGIDVALLGPKPASDSTLSIYPRLNGSVAAVQVYREQQLGVVRLWFEGVGDAPGEHRHLQIDLRGANVVSRAVLPSVELLFAQAQFFARTGPPPAPKATRSPGSSQSELRATGPSLVSATRPSRADTDWIPRLGVGPWFSGNGATPGVSLTVGAQRRLLPILFLSSELTAQPLPHEVGTALDDGDVTVTLAGVRGFLMFEPWSNADVSAGVGAGGGVLFARSSFRGTNADLAATPIVAGRVQLATPMALNFDAAFVLTANWGLPALWVKRSDETPAARLLAPAVDAMLALDWLWL